MKPLLYATFILLLLLSGCKHKKQSTTASATRTPEILVAAPARQNVTYEYEYPAYLEALQTVNLVARVSGFLEKIQFIPGQFVKAGTTLFVIEPQPYLDQVNAARAQLKSTQAKLDYAKTQYEKMKEALPGKAVSEIDYVQAQSNYQAALASLQDARAQLNIAQTNLNYCYIKAPFDGRVSRNLVDKANFVGGAAQPVTLATMYKDKTLYAYFNMAYAEFQNLPPVKPVEKENKQPLYVMDAENPSATWEGELDYTSPNVDLQTGTVTVRAIVPNTGEELLSGMYVKVRVPYKQVSQALVIPETSIGTNQAGRFVYIVGKDDKVALRPLKVGVLTANGMREITGGISADDRYVVEALMSVRPGMTVKPVTSTATAKQ